MDCSTPSSFVQGILQARTLEWVTSSSSRGNPLQGSNLCPLHLLHWQVKSLPLSHLGSWWLRKRNDWISTSSSSTCICCLFHYWLGRCQRGGDISNPAGTKILETLGEGRRGAVCRCQYNQSLRMVRVGEERGAVGQWDLLQRLKQEYSVSRLISTRE